MSCKSILRVCVANTSPSWFSQIVDVDKDQPHIRLVESQAEANSLACNAPKFATNMIPKDVIDLSSGKSIAEFAEEFERAMKKTENGEYSDTDSSDDEE